MNVRRVAGNGFTLLELMITIAVLGVILAVATPSVKKYLESQRLRSVSGELANDLQFARSEAVARKQLVGIRLDSDGTRTCYTLAAYRGTNCLGAGAGDAMSPCNCLGGAGSACTPGGTWEEIKTVSVPRSLGVRVEPPPGPYRMIAFDPTSGTVSYCHVNMISPVPPPFTVSATSASSGQLQTQVAASGRARTCATPGILVAGLPTC